MPRLATAVQLYLHEVLGVAVRGVKPWTDADALPYFLRDAFEFSEIELLGQPIVLAEGRADPNTPLSDIRTWIAKVSATAGQPAVYVTDALASYERKRLIAHKVPFIVPGNQLYLPDLGIDLREYFRQRAPAVDALSPSAQAMLIYALLRQPWDADWQPAEAASALGYTAMTLSRAVKELVAAGLATVHAAGRSRVLRMQGAPGEVWEQAKPLLRTPVRSTVWVDGGTLPANAVGRPAGLSALARLSMLAEPRWPVYALTSAEWKAATEAGVRELPEAAPGAQEWQVWCYSPALAPQAMTVDPLSLTLSLQDSTDERVQSALDELKGHFPW